MTKCKLENLEAQGHYNKDFFVDENGETVDVKNDSDEWTFDNYWCENCQETFDYWDGAKAHLGKE